MLDVKRLAAVDMALHGKRFILIEFGLGILLCIAAAWLGLMRSHAQSIWSWYLLFVGFNYVPLFLHSIALARADAIPRKSVGELDNRNELKRLSKQQFWILMPLAIIVAALWQSYRRVR